MNFNQDLNINFLKSQPTIADLNKVVKEAQSPIKLQLVISGGDKFVARQENPLMPRTSDLLSNIKINNIENRSVKIGNIFRDLDIEVLYA